MQPRRIITRLLPVKLTREEKEARANCITTNLDEIGTLENEKKLSANSYSSKIKKKQLELHKNTEAHKTGIEDRQVEIYHEMARHEGVMKTFRKDTNELISTRPLSSEEMQTKITDLFDDPWFDPKLDTVTEVTEEGEQVAVNTLGESGDDEEDDSDVE